MPGTIYIATQSFAANVDGHRVSVRSGVTRVREGHPLLEGRAGMFKPLDAHYEVEAATRAPGEKRHVPAPEPAGEFPRHVGAGWFVTPDGERHRGRDAAVAHMKDRG